MDRYRVLAIDGGGIRGIIPARVLQAIEERTGKRIAQCFDAIAGTSTGGILSLGLSKPGPDGRPQYSAQDMLGFYMDNGSAIFPHSLAREVRTGLGLLRERYSARPLEELLRARFGETMLSAALTEVVVPSYDLYRPGPFFFKREYTDGTEGGWDVPMVDVARATSAAPTYFDPAELTSPDGQSRHALVDGGTFANNPAVSVYSDALRWADGKPLVVVSLGTGQPPQTPGSGPIPITAGKATGWGLVEWARPLLEVVLDGVAKAAEYELQEIWKRTGDAPTYFRLQSGLPTASHAMDNASEENRAALLADAETLIDASDGPLDALCALL